MHSFKNNNHKKIWSIITFVNTQHLIKANLTYVPWIHIVVCHDFLWTLSISNGIHALLHGPGNSSLKPTVTDNGYLSQNGNHSSKKHPLQIEIFQGT